MSQAAVGIPGAGGAADQGAGMRLRAIISCAIGNFVELYDFLIFGLFAAQIGANFFPASNPTLPLLAAYLAYGVGFLMRPIGAIVIGSYGDRHGRKNALILTVGLMASATALTGLVPSYASIGIAGPILLIICRLVQGFSTGGEWGGAAAFLVEYAPPGKRGITGSWHQFAVGLALTGGLLTAALLNSTLSKETMLAWGWRLPFILGFVLAPVGLYVRARVSESPAFSRTVERKEVARHPLKEALGTQFGPVAAAFGLAAVGTVGNYTFNIFMPTYATKQLHIAAGTAFWSGTVAAIVLTVLTPLMGALSDRLGRKSLCLTSAVLYGVAAYPLFSYLAGSPNGISLTIVQSISAAVLAMFAGPLCAILSELFPTKVRFTALSIGYGLSVSLFGGFAPSIATWLIEVTQTPVAPAYFLIVAAIISTVTLALMKDRTNAPLD